MPNPFVNASPVKPLGQSIDLLVSCDGESQYEIAFYVFSHATTYWSSFAAFLTIAMVFSSTVVGMAGMLTFVSNIPETFKLHSLWRGMFALTVVIPICVALSSLVLGSILALAEEWTVWEGFRFVMGAACGLGTPLTSVNSISIRGRLLSVFIGVAYQGLVGVIVGITGGIGVIAAGVNRLEMSLGKRESIDEPASVMAGTGGPPQSQSAPEQKENPLALAEDGLNHSTSMGSAAGGEFFAQEGGSASHFSSL